MNTASGDYKKRGLNIMYEESYYISAREVAKAVPLSHLVLETDSPYLTPVPYRGKENQPAYVKYVAEEIAKLRGVDIEEITNITTQNAENFFGI